ncbi:MAG: Regulator of chromosome condensation, RCC1 [uncultured bacterium (gcode 4)]|uniref:Regulator of chromosome condensation, RCC1 n=1 Tax=uncultured bacterium (gcode 4) TaxID=1234023 RepID=K2G1V8_9BACT|nr:MAG: Regulator of chromosome condensation, RCC1 [uncultured bacterium (gcode 4)]
MWTWSSTWTWTGLPEAQPSSTTVFTKTLAVGSAHTCAIKSDWTVYCWWQNMSWQLWDWYITTSRTTAIQVKWVWWAWNLTWASQIAAWSNYNCSKISDWTVSCWWYNTNGQLWDNSVSQRNTPVKTVWEWWTWTILSDVSQLTAGSAHTCALKSDWTVSCWWYNNKNQVWDGSATSRRFPVKVLWTWWTWTTLGWISQVVAWYDHTCAIQNDWKVVCWWSNNYGQLWDWTTVQKNYPVPVTWLTDAVQIYWGYLFTCALKSDGTVYCWWYNNYSQLWDWTVNNQNTPIQSSVSGVSRITGWWYSMCALKTVWTVYCWWYNNLWQLWDWTNVQKNSPVQVVGVWWTWNLADAKDIAWSNAHVCVLKTDNSVYCWGDNNYWDLWDNYNVARYYPVQVASISPTFTDVAQIESGWFHSCATKADWNAYCWWDDFYSQLWDWTAVSRSSPIRVGLSWISKLSWWYRHTCAVKTDWSAYCWWYNNYWTIWDGTFSSSVYKTTPTLVSWLSWMSDVSAGWMSTCALKNDWTVFCWWSGSSWLLWNWLTTQQNSPVQVKWVGWTWTLSWITQIDVWYWHACGLHTSWSVYCWGSNSSGQLWDGTTTARTTPVQVKVNASTYLWWITQITVWQSHTCATASDWNAYCWWYNSKWQLWDDSIINRSYPVQVSGLSWVSQITSNMYSFHTCAKKTDWTAYCWGDNSNGQLWNDSTTDSKTPVQVSGMSWVSQISAWWYLSYYHTCASKTDWTAYCWWGNGYWELWDFYLSTNRKVPYQVVWLPMPWTLN